MAIESEDVLTFSRILNTFFFLSFSTPTGQLHFPTRRGQFPLATRGRHWRVWETRFYAIHVSDIRRCQVLATCRHRPFRDVGVVVGDGLRNTYSKLYRTGPNLHAQLNAFLETKSLCLSRNPIRNLSVAIERCLNLRPVFDLFSFHLANLFAARLQAKYLIDAHIFRESKTEPRHRLA